MRSDEAAKIIEKEKRCVLTDCERPECKNCGLVMDTGEILEALDMAISALKKQGQDNNKSCVTCKYKRLSVSEFPCSACFESEFKDYYREPCKAELTQREIRKEKEEAVIFFIVFSIFIFILCGVSIVID